MIRIKDLSFTYPGAAAPVLSGLNFHIEQGEIYGLLGPSGSGKSTTQKILMGLLRGFSGTALAFDQPIQSFDRGFYERIGVSFELPTLYLRLTARENLALFGALYDKPTRDPMEILSLVDLSEAADQPVENFSKGMKMRLNLCRSLIHDPELLFFDEPTTGQDPARARITHQLILKLKSEGKTIFLTTHNMAEADEICDRVGFLTNGNIPVSGRPEDLKRQYWRPELEVTARTEAGIEKTRFPMENLAQNKEFLETLGQNNILSLHTREASLDDAGKGRGRTHGAGRHAPFSVHLFLVQNHHPDRACPNWVDHNCFDGPS